MSREKTPLYYTFGNHMHWVDMQWLWGYHVMPGSTFDMLHFAEVAGAKGNVNFDGVGYEKLAAEAPEALDALRQAVREGRIEPVGCSYAQPYGLFHGGESNIRHRVYGARAVRRLLGVWPKTFWEEEFDFFPQLPQMLRGCGFEYASLYFQWTWHTPEVPRETVPAVWWEGQDGSRLLTATRNALNLHQWPEDMQILFDQLAAGEQPVKPLGDVPPLILQWVELMPSPDWMCRSEVLLPKLTELLSDVRFEIKPCTLGEYLRLASSVPDIPVRRYSLDDVWHGMSLGKNGDHMRKESRRLESELLASESLATVLGLFGRPYPRWDVYPVWELEEAWRHLLIAQHHDNDECEALCGHVAVAGHAYAEKLSPMNYMLAHLAERTGVRERALAVNGLGWTVQVPMADDPIPPMGYAPTTAPFMWGRNGEVFDEPLLRHRLGGWIVIVDQQQGLVSFEHPNFPAGCFRTTPRVSFLRNGERVTCDRIDQVLHHEQYLSINFASSSDVPWVCFTVDCDQFGVLKLDVSVRWLEFQEEGWYRYQADAQPDPGMGAGVHVEFEPVVDDFRLITDSPYAVHGVHPKGEWPKKYPEGDWMTSPQWFESIEKPFHSTSLVDLINEGGSGLMIVHESGQWFRTHKGLANLLTMRDPWDNGQFRPDVSKSFWLVPHGPWTNRDRWQAAQTLLNPPIQREPSGLVRAALKPEVDMPKSFGGLELLADHSLVTAFYRESEDAGKHVEDYAGKGMGYPTIVRIVEFNGVGETAILKLPGEVAAVYKTNLLGGEPQALATSPTEPPSYSPEGWSWTAIEVPLRPYEIATLYVDLVQARKQTRDLDAKREVWATVHRVE